MFHLLVEKVLGEILSPWDNGDVGSAVAHFLKLDTVLLRKVLGGITSSLWFCVTPTECGPA